MIPLHVRVFLIVVVIILAAVGVAWYLSPDYAFAERCANAGGKVMLQGGEGYVCVVQRRIQV